jgi:L,D-peptidoglycan transpeptidase YkuD (ErfK/YbiS/YcfS/YnhG family)
MNITVTLTDMSATTGVLTLDGLGLSFPCTLGRAGAILPDQKTEGDGKTPLGTYPLRMVFYRADRMAKPETALPTAELTQNTGWCEKPNSPFYNQAVALPHPDVTDEMYRDDAVYDVVVVIGYNDAPVVAHKGSAIFMHHARPDFTPTAGCVGLRPDDLLKTLKHLDQKSTITIKIKP